jgi:hypothetical protein
MNFAPIFRLAGALTLTLGLAGCIDMTSDVYVTSSTTAKATVTSTMSSEVYGMFKGGDDDDEAFCAEPDSTLTENADGSATCVVVSEGSFAELDFDDEGSRPVFTTNPDGTVRIAIATEGMLGDFGDADDAETAEMMKALFDGHFLTLRFGGADIVDSNMERAPDSANYVEMKLPFLGLLDGSLALPSELYAVIRP